MRCTMALRSNADEQANKMYLQIVDLLEQLTLLAGEEGASVPDASEWADDLLDRGIDPDAGEEVMRAVIKLHRKAREEAEE